MSNDVPINLKTLYTELLAAYPNYDDLDRLLYYDCNLVVLSEICQGVGQKAVAHSVIKDAVAKGWLHTLVAAAAADRPKNDQLAEMARLLAARPPSVSPTVATVNDNADTGLVEVPPPNSEAIRLVLTLEDLRASVRDRIAAGRRLADLGDPRPGVGLRPDGVPDIVWCEAPAGKFIFGGDIKAFNSRHQTVIHLPAFRIGKYPVTSCQFRAFITASDGYGNPVWWNGLHKDGHAQQISGPGDRGFKYDNHPCENVSWYDAMAFCRWLTTILGFEVRLPTEKEWEKAARGADGRVYPYGNKFDACEGNTKDSGIAQTSAVGAFSGGASPYGAVDMSGNVWEWTLTENDIRLYSNARSIRRRVLRGGSWNDDRNYARSASRFNIDPVSRNSSMGFRLASAIPSASLRSDSEIP